MLNLILKNLTDIIIEGTGAAEAVYCWVEESSLWWLCRNRRWDIDIKRVRLDWGVIGGYRRFSVWKKIVR